LKKVVFKGIKKLEVTNVEKPKLINPWDVLLKIGTVGICGSDMHYFNEGKIGDQLVHYPFTPGHEGSGKVVEVGSEVSRVKVDDIVAIEPAVSCHKCSQCLSGREHTCLNQKFLGSPGELDGCLAEYIIVPEKNCYPVPKNMNSEEAALVEPLSIGYYSVSFLKDLKNIKSAAILGVGPIGMGVMICLQNHGINEICATDKLDYRLSAAKDAGAKWIGNPDKVDVVSSFKNFNAEQFDVVFECCGKQEAIDQAVDILKPGGMLLIVGIPEVNRISFNINNIRRKEIRIQNVRRQNKSIQPVIDLIASRKLRPNFMVTHRFQLDDSISAFKTVEEYDDGVIKALIKF
jgi:L-iditol 2-dehydrogenase